MTRGVMVIALLSFHRQVYRTALVGSQRSLTSDESGFTTDSLHAREPYIGRATSRAPRHGLGSVSLILSNFLTSIFKE